MADSNIWRHDIEALAHIACNTGLRYIERHFAIMRRMAGYHILLPYRGERGLLRRSQLQKEAPVIFCIVCLENNRLHALRRHFHSGSNDAAQLLDNISRHRSGMTPTARIVSHRLISRCLSSSRWALDIAFINHCKAYYDFACFIMKKPS